jgi:NADPH-dependent 2,4-dienoyl-CoA reductase/sulfur reductase-like enzyme
MVGGSIQTLLFDVVAGKHLRIEHWTGALERAALAVQALLDQNAPQQPLKPPYFWSDQHGVKIQFAGHSAGYDRLDIEAGDPQEHSFLAVYYRGEDPVTVLGMNQPRLFTKWRRNIVAPALAADGKTLLPAVAS